MTYLEASKCGTNRNFTSNTWYSNTWMLSQDSRKWWYRITIGSGGRGKTYSGRRLAIKSFLNKGRAFIWLRLTNQAVDNLLQNNASGLFPTEMIRKYGITVTNRGNAIYINDKLAGYVASIQGYYNNKGQELSLPDYRLSTTLKKNKQLGEFDIFADELIREESERNTFDIKKAFQNQIENVVRERKGIRVFVYANYLTEITDLEELFDIHIRSGKFGIYRNHKTRAVVEYLEDSEEWKARKKDTYAGVLNASGGRFSNKANEDNRLIIYDNQLRGAKVQFNIKIKDQYFAIKAWKGKLVLTYLMHNENNKKVFCLKPEYMTYSEQTYSPDIRRQLADLFAAGKLAFSSYNAYLLYINSK